MRFASPDALWLLALVPIVATLFAATGRRRRRALARLGEARLVARLAPATSPARERLKATLFLAALVFLVLAIARPQWGRRAEQVVRTGVDVVLALDTSFSMDATDVVPSRLEKARGIASALIERLDGNRIGLVVFAGDAFVQCPLTLDYGAARIFLDAVYAGVVPEPGTDLAAAIRAATRAFEARASTRRVLVLLTDGERHEGDTEAAVAEARERGVVIHAIGVGTPSGEPVPVRDEQGRIVDYKKDESGRPVLSRLDEATLRGVAAGTGGRYFRASESEEEVEAIAGLVDAMEKDEVASRLYTQYRERFGWPLGVALALLTTETLIPRGRRRRSS